eukprot:119293-Pleurochrysis_carterae.AAC.1
MPSYLRTYPATCVHTQLPAYILGYQHGARASRFGDMSRSAQEQSRYESTSLPVLGVGTEVDPDANYLL